MLLAEQRTLPFVTMGGKAIDPEGGGNARLTGRVRTRRRKKETIITGFADRPFDWVAALALVSGAAVIIPSLAALAATLLAVAATLM